jgi:putative transposase
MLVPWYKGTLERFQGTMNHDLMQGSPGTTFSNILERDDYDPGQHAVVMLSTFREILHKWIIDVYLQTPHRGIQDTPAHRWHAERRDLPPPLPPSAHELDVVLGMTVQRVVFHYGIELEGLKYNSLELGELRRRLRSPAKVELTFDPGDLGHINVADQQKRTYIRVPAVDQAYAEGLSLWQHRVIRRYSRNQLKGRTDLLALAEANVRVAVGISVARYPPHRSPRAVLPHEALILDEWRQSELRGKDVGRADLGPIAPPVVAFAPSSGSLADRDG